MYEDRSRKHVATFRQPKAEGEEKAAIHNNKMWVLPLREHSYNYLGKFERSAVPR
jgi:hypothetical protein